MLIVLDTETLEALSCDAELAGQLALALNLGRKALERANRQPHPVMRAIERMCGEQLRRSEEGGGPESVEARSLHPEIQDANREWLTPRQYAELMQVHISTVRRWLNKGEIPDAERHGNTWRTPRPKDKS